MSTGPAAEPLCELRHVSHDFSQPNGQPRRQLSVERAKKLLGWESKTSFEEGLKKTIDWWRNNQ